MGQCLYYGTPPVAKCKLLLLDSDIIIKKLFLYYTLRWGEIKKKMLVWLSIWKNILKKDRKTMKLRYRTIKMVMLLD